MQHVNQESEQLKMGRIGGNESTWYHDYDRTWIWIIEKEDNR